ncbi:plastidial pyruvate kinase 2 [Dorcoceras hygrometricum]|uniref:pyruvate kinase n=1 Tax=Dorcoceras hygrometricum TaxID=472368 RepID=A0A2Z7C2R5_9LAMI|nr:plastidial pyruvate kinase 2 [Dorcoceras hygrometricum]
MFQLLKVNNYNRRMAVVRTITFNGLESSTRIGWHDVILDCGSDVHIIVKIDTADSITNLHSITASDGAMIARGDLGAELPIEEVPSLQQWKKLLEYVGKANVMATNMLGEHDSSSYTYLSRQGMEKKGFGRCYPHRYCPQMQVAIQQLTCGGK